MSNVVKKERNGMTNIISDIKNLAFAWASYYANQSNIFICGIEYRIDIIRNANITFSNGNETGFGNWVIFKNCKDNSLIIFKHEVLKQLRNSNPVTENLYCLSEDTFI